MIQKKQDPPFIYGTQYYRAPTPERACWAEDLAHIRALGMDAVKFWVQWRWSERRRGEYNWDDLDELMSLAQAQGLHVTLNFITEVAPAWLYRDYPDVPMVRADGIRCESTANICRQIGGYPGPCYHHDAARQAKREFITAAVRHFQNHPALSMWDVWNEPEANLMLREPNLATMVCYCPACARKFPVYLQEKYTTIEHLNQVWGRCYNDWSEVELPRQSQTITDFIDWREFHLQKLAMEAQWKIALVKELDPQHLVYLHVVPDTAGEFNAVTCVDDFAMAAGGDVFASTMTPSTLHCAQAVSAGAGRVFYNAEWHVNFGSSKMPQRVLDCQTFYYELLPQFGWGVKGILYWQFRGETLGTEAPAWGVVRPDGSERAVTRYAEEFGRKIAPYRELLLRAQSAPPQIGVWRSPANEIFHFCSDGALKLFHDNLRGYTDTLYRLNLPFKMVNSDLLASDSGSIKLLILPGAYLLTEQDAALLARFVENGGVVFADGHLGAFNYTSGRHSERTPGLGLGELWQLEETEIYSTWHWRDAVKSAGRLEVGGDSGAAAKLAGVEGGEFAPLTALDGTNGLGAQRIADVDGANLTTLVRAGDCRTVVYKALHTGALFYAGTQLGRGALIDDALLRSLLSQAASTAGVQQGLQARAVHADVLYDGEEAAILILNNSGEGSESVTLPLDGRWRELLTGDKQELKDKELVLPAKSAQLWIKNFDGGRQ